MPRILILDGNSLANRAFYALPMLTASDGRPTNVLHGFMTMLLKLQAEQQPDYWVVAFDKTKATVRIEQYAGYKAQRKETPQELKPQFAFLKEVLQGFSVPILELEGYEADDLIATITTRAEQAGLEVQIYTGDKDALQLISPQTRVCLTKKGISEVECYDEQVLFERYQLRPQQIIDLKGLMGDTSDNIPGIPGVGEKTALKLLWEYGNVENVLNRWQQVSGKKLQSSLVEYADQARMSKDLATMIHDAPIAFDLEDFRFRQPDREQALAVLTNYDLRNVIRIWQERMGPPSASQSGDLPKADSDLAEWPMQSLGEQEWLEQCAKWQKSRTPLTVAYRITKSDSGERTWAELGIASDEQTYQMIRAEANPRLVEAINALLTDPGVPKTVNDGKPLMLALLNEGYKIAGIELDLSLAAYLINSARTKFASIDLVRDYFPEVNDLSDPALEGAALAQVRERYTGQLAALGLADLLHRMEEPLSSILAGMEHEGITIDTEQLNEFGRQLNQDVAKLEEEIYTIAEERFNLNSPQQLGRVLFEKLGLPPQKKNKTGYSTDAETLEELRLLHPVIDKLLDYRQLSKLISTYVNGLLAQVREGKIHTTFQQTVAATGRLSSTDPNLQNIPIRLEHGRLLRKVFRPNRTGWLLFSADYSQIELRILAHYSQDPLLCESFSLGQDVHARTAAEVFGVPLDQVTGEMRRRAKAVNFGLVYGLTDFGLSRDLGIPRREAKQYVDQYFARYAGVQRYLAEVVMEAKERGEVRTLLQRLRRIPELKSANRVQRQFGERIAMNTPIQGTAADIMKLAMISVAEGLAQMKSQANMLLQVHDELVFEVPPEELPLLAVMVKERMEQAYTLAVPLTVEMKAGANWYDMKKLD